MITPHEYQGRRAAIQTAYEREFARAEHPHPLWPVIKSFGSEVFTRDDLYERVQQLRKPEGRAQYSRRTIDATVDRLVTGGLLRRVAWARYEADARAERNIAKKLHIAEIRRAGQLRKLEHEWRESPFHGLTAAKVANSKLPPVAAGVLLARLQNETLEEIGDRLGMSREGVRLIQRQGLKELRRL